MRCVAWTLCSLAAGALAHSSSDRMYAFERVYKEGRWTRGADGALCSSGWSNVASGQGVAALGALLSVIKMIGARSIADVPCGDGCFAGALLDALSNRTSDTSGNLAPTPVEYVGVDIVHRLIDDNRQRYGSNAVHFVQADVISSSWIPNADLVFSRQMLQHMCTDDALRFIRLVAHSSAKYALLTTFETDDSFVNTDIGCASGDYRAQDLTKPPFSLPRPMMLFSEEYPVDRRVALGLWPVWALRRRLL